MPAIGGWVLLSLLGAFGVAYGYLYGAVGLFGGLPALLLFGVMLTHKLYDLDLKTETFQVVPGLLVMLAVLATLVGVVLGTQWHRQAERPMNPTTAEIGKLFMRDYILPFEAASVLLLIALIGAAMIVRRRES